MCASATSFLPALHLANLGFQVGTIATRCRRTAAHTSALGWRCGGGSIDMAALMRTARRLAGGGGAGLQRSTAAALWFAGPAQTATAAAALQHRHRWQPTVRAAATDAAAAAAAAPASESGESSAVDPAYQQPQPATVAENDALLQSIVKVFTVHSSPNYFMPWQNKPQRETSGSGVVMAVPVPGGQGRRGYCYRSQRRQYVF